MLWKESPIVQSRYMAEDSYGCAWAEGSGQYPQEYATGVVSRPCVGRDSDPLTQQLLEQVIESENMRLAWDRSFVSVCIMVSSLGLFPCQSLGATAWLKSSMIITSRSSWAKCL